MPRGSWSEERERQHEHVKDSALERREDISSGRRGALRSHKGSGGPTYRQLYDEARRRGIRGRSFMSKQQLERALT